MKSSILLIPALFSAVSWTTLLDANPSKAVLYIDFIPLPGNQTRIKASGSLDRNLLPSGSGNAAAAGNETSDTGSTSSRLVTGTNDAVRFTYTPTSTPVASNPGTRFRISGEANPFRGSNATFSFVTTQIPTNNPFFILRTGNGAANLGGQDFWLPNTYISNDPISGFFDVNASLSQIGLFNSSGAIAANIVYTLGGEQIVLREIVPGPLPALGAATAFAYSRKIRKRIRKSGLDKVS